MNLEIRSLIRRSILFRLHIAGMHFTNSDVTNEGFLNNYLDSSSNNYPLTLNSRIEIIAGLHPLDNQYLPNEVIAGWFGEEPENDHPIPLDDHRNEDFSYDANPEPEVENLPRVAPVSNS